MTQVDDRCETCQYWVQPGHTPKPEYGECRRAPEKKQPMKHQSFWCGEYRSRLSMKMDPLRTPEIE